MLACVTPVAAAPSGSTFTLDMRSAAVWRGLALNDGMVLQPSIGFGWNDGLDLDAWVNIGPVEDPVTGQDQSIEMTDLEMRVSQAAPLAPVDLRVGIVAYHRRDTRAVTVQQEGFVSAAFEAAGVGLVAEIYHDLANYHGYYATFGANHALPLGDVLSVQTGAAVGYAGRDFALGGRSGWHDYMLSLGLTCAANPDLVLGLVMAYSGSLDESVLPPQRFGWHGGFHIGHRF